MYPEKINILLLENRAEVLKLFKEVFNEVKINITTITAAKNYTLSEALHQTAVVPDLVFINASQEDGLIPALQGLRRKNRLHNIIVAAYSGSREDAEGLLTAGANIHILYNKDHTVLKKSICTALKLSWQYIADGLDKENFMVSY